MDGFNVAKDLALGIGHVWVSRKYVKLLSEPTPPSLLRKLLLLLFQLFHDFDVLTVEDACLVIKVSLMFLVFYHDLLFPLAQRELAPNFLHVI
jgi:hypothetical protein